MAPTLDFLRDRMGAHLVTSGSRKQPSFRYVRYQHNPYPEWPFEDWPVPHPTVPIAVLGPKSAGRRGEETGSPRLLGELGLAGLQDDLYPSYLSEEARQGLEPGRFPLLNKQILEAPRPRNPFTIDDFRLAGVRGINIAPGGKKPTLIDLRTMSKPTFGEPFDLTKPPKGSLVDWKFKGAGKGGKLTQRQKAYLRQLKATYGDKPTDLQGIGAPIHHIRLPLTPEMQRAADAARAQVPIHGTEAELDPELSSIANLLGHSYGVPALEHGTSVPGRALSQADQDFGMSLFTTGRGGKPASPLETGRELSQDLQPLDPNSEIVIAMLNAIRQKGRN